MNKRLPIFINSIFFVLGFSIIFSIVGVLLQSALSNVAYTVQNWLAYVGGTIIIFFGLYLLGFIKIGFLEKEYKFKIKRKFKYSYITSFVFGAAFAVGWTPCVTAALGAILALASTQPSSAFFLLFSYTLGLGLPFLVVGWFTSEAQGLIERMGKFLKYFQYFFGVILILLGILIFTSQLSRIANWEGAISILSALKFGTSAGQNIMSLNLVNLGISFLAGLGSFLSPCVLPIVPGFLSYLASTGAKKETEEEQ